MVVPGSMVVPGRLRPALLTYVKIKAGQGR
jgi:hypothetical protein